MKFNFQVLNNGKRWDAIGIGDGLVATVELTNHNGRTMSDWWFSGLNGDGELVALARISFGLGVNSPDEATLLLAPIYEDVLREPLNNLLALGGFSDAPNTGSNENKRALSLTHLYGHEQIGHIGKDIPIRLDATRQCQLIKSFGYSNAQRLMAERSGLPKTTIDRRLFVARESGLLAKMTKAPDIKK